jgi:hypothetical protein
MGQNQSFDFFLRISLIKGPYAWLLIMGAAFFEKKKTKTEPPNTGNNLKCYNYLLLEYKL